MRQKIHLFVGQKEGKMLIKWVKWKHLMIFLPFQSKLIATLIKEKAKESS